jgi:hypothetical protein
MSWGSEETVSAKATKGLQSQQGDLLNRLGTSQGFPCVINAQVRSDDERWSKQFKPSKVLTHTHSSQGLSAFFDPKIRHHHADSLTNASHHFISPQMYVIFSIAFGFHRFKWKTRLLFSCYTVYVCSTTVTLVPEGMILYARQEIGSHFSSHDSVTILCSVQIPRSVMRKFRRSVWQPSFLCINSRPRSQCVRWNTLRVPYEKTIND